MKLLNNQIYSYASELSKLDMNEINMPVRINFFLQKNILMNESKRTIAISKVMFQVEVINVPFSPINPL